MIIPVRCFTCGRVMADIVDYYENEKANIEENKNVDKLYKNFDKIHTSHILDNLGLKRYCCRRNLIANIDMMEII
jgi:DNA-directed RNA polymerase subunit N|uniref:DNA-directed RNA polymerase RPB10 homolog n=1 Tax=Virus NIOZ-UU159 TaxID=2763270 RepID=A0A7S9XEH2_9VIRU|nr:MAG: DNA-directed RNA polymerase subunit N [Virus NIOZ-UU159]|tara:strand:- start:2229 stop:2453 length:225 start_codon:yes stop_codon:yes gene_type:complete